jgi:nicotinamidase/pyrazinamidase
MKSQKLIFWDVDTQADFMLPGGALYVPGAEKIIPNLKRLVDSAHAGGVLLVSSTDAHTPDDPEFASWPPHCVAGTPGQKKIPETLLENRAVVQLGEGGVPAGLAENYDQVIVEKRALDVFTNPRTQALLDQLPRHAEFAVFGVVTEYCVRMAGMGLLERGRRVALVADAIESLAAPDGQRALAEMTSRGARVVRTDEVLAML